MVVECIHSMGSRHIYTLHGCKRRMKKFCIKMCSGMIFFLSTNYILLWCLKKKDQFCITLPLNIFKTKYVTLMLSKGLVGLMRWGYTLRKRMIILKFWQFYFSCDKFTSWSVGQKPSVTGSPFPSIYSMNTNSLWGTGTTTIWNF